MLNSATSLRLLAPLGSASDKPLFVFLPGMDGTGELLVRQVPELQPHFDIRCLAIPRTDLTPWEGMATQIIRMIQQVAGDRPIYLGGESFGACLALQVMGQAPDLVDYSILINSASSLHRFPWPHWLTHLMPWELLSLLQATRLGQLPLLADPGRIRSADYQRLLRAIQSVSQASMAWRLALLAQFRLEPLNLQRVKAPTLLVASLADRLLPSLQEAEQLATLLPNTRFYALPHSGHASLLETEVSLGHILAEVDFLPPPIDSPITNPAPASRRCLGMF